MEREASLFGEQLSHVELLIVEKQRPKNGPEYIYQQPKSVYHIG